MGPNDEKELSEAEQQAELHWKYVDGVLATHLVSQSEREKAGHHYKTAFVHGWKHGQEAMNGKAKG